MSNRPNKRNVSIQQVLAALLDTQNVFPPAYLRHFSDLEGADLEALRSIWPQVAPTRRANLLEDLEELADSDTLVSFDNVANMALDDPEPRVRTVAIRLLWEAENPRLAPVLLKLLKKDSDSGVRAAAATGLGLFVYLGELEEIPEDLHRRVEDNLLLVYASQEDALVRRRVLESLGFSGRKEVAPLIRAAYETEDPDWVSSALFAMGRSADDTWGPEVIRMLRHPRTNVQLEAIRAAGELALSSARRTLLQLLDDEHQDSEIRAAIYWSLSQIGGDDVREILEEHLEKAEDDDEIGVLEDALDNLTFTEDTGLERYGLLDFDRLGETDKEVSEDMLDLEEEEADQEDDSSPNPDSGAKRSRRRHS